MSTQNMTIEGLLGLVGRIHTWDKLPQDIVMRAVDLYSDCLDMINVNDTFFDKLKGVSNPMELMIQQGISLDKALAGIRRAYEAKVANGSQADNPEQLADMLENVRQAYAKARQR